MSILAATIELRRDLSVLTDSAERQISRLFRKPTSADAMKEVLLNELPAVVEMHGSAAATLTADWYDDLRVSERVPGRFRAIPAEPAGGVGELVGWAMDSAYKAVPDWAAVLFKTLSGAQKRVLNSSRETVMLSARRDAGASGWQRYTMSDACLFCVMIASRGAIFRTRTADFAAHDNCRCTVSPVWGNKMIPVSAYKRSKRWDTKYGPGVAERNRRHVREWIERNRERLSTLDGEDWDY